MRDLRAVVPVVALTVALVGGASAVAVAVTIDLPGRTLGTRSLTSAACDTGGMTVGVDTPMDFPAGSAPGFTVVRFSLSGVDAACDGKRYTAALQSAGGSCTAVGRGVLAVSGGTAFLDVRTPGCTMDWNTGLSVSVYD